MILKGLPNVVLGLGAVEFVGDFVRPSLFSSPDTSPESVLVGLSPVTLDSAWSEVDSASQNIVPLAESSMMYPLGAVAVGGVGIVKGVSATAEITDCWGVCTSIDDTSIVAADSLSIAESIRA